MNNSPCVTQAMIDVIKKQHYTNISNLNLNKTMLFIIDMVNGFATCGNLYSPRVEKLIIPIANFTKQNINNLYSVIALNDAHYCNSLEFLSYPCHSLKNTFESQLVCELFEIEGIKVIEKNSINGFLVLNDCILRDFNYIDNVIVVGNATDICVYQFVMTLRSYFNQYNLNKNIIVPMNMVDTYDEPNSHPADLFNIVFLNSMILNGINVTKGFY